MIFDGKNKIFLYMDGSSLKAANVSGSGDSASIQSICNKDVSGLDEVGLLEEIASAVRSVGSDGKGVTVFLNSSFAITKALEVPSFDDGEIKAIVDLQASRHTPYTREEIVTNFMNLETVKDRYTKALLTIVPLVNIERHLQYLQEAGVEINKVHVGFEGMAAGLVKTGAVPAETVTAVIAVRSHHTDFIVMHQEKPFFVRSIDIGARELEGGGRREEWLKEIVKSNNAYKEEEPQRAIEKVLAMGPSTAGITSLADEAGGQLSVSAETLSCADSVPMSSSARKQLEEGRSVMWEDICLTAWAGESLEMDLIPSEHKTRRQFRRRAKDIFNAGVASMAVFVLLFGMLLGKVYLKKAYLLSLDKKFAIKNAEAETLVVLSEQNRLIRDLQYQKKYALNVLTEMERILPDEMYLNEVSLDEGGQVAIKGTSELMSSVFSFVTNFENSSVFKNISSDYAKSRKIDGKDVTDFGLSASIEEEGA